MEGLNQTYTEVYQTSAIVLGYWNVLIAIIGLPLNVFIIIATFLIPKNDFVPIYCLILALSITDCFLLVGFAMILPYSLTLKETICKYGGVCVYGAGYVNLAIPLFMAWNRHAVICETRFNHWFSEKKHRHYACHGHFVHNTVHLTISTRRHVWC